MSTVVIGIRVDPDVRAALKAAADAERRPIGQYLRLVLEDHVKTLTAPVAHRKKSTPSTKGTRR